MLVIPFVSRIVENVVIVSGNIKFCCLRRVRSNAEYDFIILNRNLSIQITVLVNTHLMSRPCTCIGIGIRIICVPICVFPLSSIIEIHCCIFCGSITSDTISIFIIMAKRGCIFGVNISTYRTGIRCFTCCCTSCCCYRRILMITFRSYYFKSIYCICKRFC